jgi:hypothetical protein
VSSAWSPAQNLSQLKIEETNGSGQEPPAPNGIVSPTSLDFGQVLVGKTSPQFRVSLKNTGDTDMTVSTADVKSAQFVGYCIGAGYHNCPASEY